MSQQLLVIDLAPLRELSGDDPIFIREILEMIAMQSPVLSDKIRLEYAEENYLSLAKTAHKFKSSLQILGNPHLVGLAQEIEHLAHQEHGSPRLAQLMNSFDSICDQLLDIIRHELQQLTQDEPA